jgi:hypothetical protein
LRLLPNGTFADVEDDKYSSEESENDDEPLIKL